MRTHVNGGDIKIKPQKTCYICHQPITSWETMIETEEGPAHYTPCAVKRAIEKLDEVNLPRPTQFGEQWQLLDHLEELTKSLLEKPANNEHEKQIATVFSIAGYLRSPIKLLHMVAR